jgi:hypothetical protein
MAPSTLGGSWIGCCLPTCVGTGDQTGTVIMLSIKYYCPQFDHLYTEG